MKGYRQNVLVMEDQRAANIYTIHMLINYGKVLFRWLEFYSHLHTFQTISWWPLEYFQWSELLPDMPVNHHVRTSGSNTYQQLTKTIQNCSRKNTGSRLESICADDGKWDIITYEQGWHPIGWESVIGHRNIRRYKCVLIKSMRIQKKQHSNL